MITDDDETESRRNDHNDEESPEPYHEALQHEEPTLKKDNHEPQGVVTKNLKTILLVVCIVILGIAICFANNKKKVATKEDTTAQTAQSNAAATDPSRGASQLHSQVRQDEGQIQRQDERSASQALAVAQGGQDIHPLYDSNGQALPAGATQNGAYRGGVALSNYGGRAAAPTLQEELAAQRTEIEKKYQELHFHARFQNNLVYRAEVIQPGQQQSAGGQQYSQSASTAGGGGGQSPLTPQQLQAAMAAAVAQAHPLSPMRPGEEQNAMGQSRSESQHGHDDSKQETAKAHDRSSQIDVNKATGKPFILFEGTFLDTVLVNRLDGDAAGPVITMVTQPVYSHDRQHVLIPEGSKVYGEARKIGEAGFGQQRRVAIVFHRIIMPDGYSVDLDQYNGLDQLGSMGAKDKINNHYTQIFGTSVALGVLAGASQVMQGGSSSTNTTGGQLFTNGASSSMSSSSTSILNKFLQIPVTITIRPGNRLKVYFTQDIRLPAYGNHAIKQTY